MDSSATPTIVGVSANVVAQSETVASDVIGVIDDIADKKLPKVAGDVAALVVDVADCSPTSIRRLQSNQHKISP